MLGYLGYAAFAGRPVLARTSARRSARRWDAGMGAVLALLRSGCDGPPARRVWWLIGVAGGDRRHRRGIQARTRSAYHESARPDAGLAVQRRSAASPRSTGICWVPLGHIGPR